MTIRIDREGAFLTAANALDHFQSLFSLQYSLDVEPRLCAKNAMSVVRVRVLLYYIELNVNISYSSLSDKSSVPLPLLSLS